MADNLNLEHLARPANQPLTDLVSESLACLSDLATTLL